MPHIRDEDGFTLLEVLIASAIMALSMAALFPIFAAIPARVKAIHEQMDAAAISQALMNEQALLRNISHLPASYDGAIEHAYNSVWTWKMVEKPVDEEEEQDVVIPGRAIHVELLLTHAFSGKDYAYQQVFWVVE